MTQHEQVIRAQQITDQRIRAREITEHNRQRQRLNATCPECATDLLDELKTAAHDWGGYGPPSTVTIDCHACEAELTFRLHWNAVLTSATQETQQ